MDEDTLVAKIGGDVSLMPVIACLKIVVPASAGNWHFSQFGNAAAASVSNKDRS